MKDYSIEYATQHINSEKTKEYFKEVVSSYFNNNFRAAVVTLYSVVINDIIIKLETLDEIYSDITVKDILKKIKRLQEENPNNPEWEKTLIEEVKNRTNLFDNVDYAHIHALKLDRHLCAHPVVSKEDKLYTPNKETVAAHIRNMLESLFEKPAILSKKILETLLKDIAEKKDILIDDDSIEKYIIAKYLTNLNSTTEISMFRDLWKFVFRLTNKECEENRFINYHVLYLLYKRNISTCQQKIKDEKEYFNSVHNSGFVLNLLVRFLSENEFLYKEFRDDVRLLIEKHIEKDNNAKTVAWFLSDSYLHHLENIKSWCENDAFFEATGNSYRRVLQVGIAKNYVKEVIDFAIWRYINVKNYDDGDKVFSFIINPFLKKFTVEHFTFLCENINDNPQAYGRRRAEEDHKILKKQIIIKVGSDFDFYKYPNIFIS